MTGTGKVEERGVRLVAIGDGSVGKTSLLHRFADNEFEVAYRPTLGLDFYTKYVTINGERVLLRLWDTAGSEAYRAITKNWLRGAEAVGIVFDVTNKQSYASVANWKGWVEENAGNVGMILIGNKCDLTPDLELENIDTMGLEFFQTSAKTGEGVDQAFQSLAQKALEHTAPAQVTVTPLQAAPLPKEDKKGCCN